MLSRPVGRTDRFWSDWEGQDKTISVLIQKKLTVQKSSCMRTLTYQYSQSPLYIKILNLSKENNLLRIERNIPFKKGDKVCNLATTFWPSFFRRKKVSCPDQIYSTTSHIKDVSIRSSPLPFFLTLRYTGGRELLKSLHTFQGQNWNSDTGSSDPKCNKLNTGSPFASFSHYLCRSSPMPAEVLLLPFQSKVKQGMGTY